MNLDLLVRPFPLYPSVILAGFFGWKCWTVKRWPGADKVIELLVLGGAFYQVTLLALSAYRSCFSDGNEGFGLLIGAFAIGYVASKQTYVLFNSIEPDPAGNLKKFKKRKG